MSKKNDAIFKYVAYGILGIVAIVILFSVFVVPAGTHRYSKSSYALPTYSNTKNNKLDVYQNINVKTPDGSVDMQQHIKETANNVVYEINGKHIEIDKNIIFSQECEPIEKLENNPQITTYMYTTYYIYLVRDFFIDWCNITDTKKYMNSFNSVFEPSLNKYDGYLQQHYGKNYKKCAIDPLLQVRKKYDFERLDTVYTESIKDWTNKFQFCTTMKTDSDFMTKIFFSIKTEEIEYMEKQPMQITEKKTTKDTNATKVSQSDQQKAALKKDSYLFCKYTQEKAIGGYITQTQQSVINDVCECISNVDVSLATKPLLDIYTKKGYDHYVLAVDDKVAKKKTDECFNNTAKKYGL